MSEDYGQNSVAIPVDDILGEGFTLLSQQITLAIASAATLVRGTVLGLITTGAAALSVRIPRPFGHRFHGHSATDSTLIRPPVPRRSGH